MFATNWCVWIRILVHETFESFLHHAAISPSHASGGHGTGSHLSINITHMTSQAPYSNTVQYSEYQFNGTTDATHYDAMHCPLFVDELLLKASPYLFPCVLEYSLLAAATMYSMFADIDHMNSDNDVDNNNTVDSPKPLPAWIAQSQNHATHNNMHEGTTNRGSLYQGGGPERNKSKNGAKNADHPTHVHLTEVNFHKTHRGLFLGLIIFACTAVSILLFFSYKGEGTSMHLFIYYISDNVLQGLLLVVVLIGWVQIQRLQFTPHVNGMSVDQTLLVLAMSGVFLFHMFKMFAIFHSINSSHHVGNVIILNFTASILALLLCLTQTCFIIDGMSRSSVTRDNLKDKPGRGSITFLLFANIATWLFKTFQMKEIQIETSAEMDVYGYLATKLIAHTFSPLLIFYYYHCSACVAHIWSHAYTKETVQAAEEANKPPTPTTQPPLPGYGHNDFLENSVCDSDDTDIWDAFRPTKSIDTPPPGKLPHFPISHISGTGKKKHPLSPIIMPINVNKDINSGPNHSHPPNTPTIMITKANLKEVIVTDLDEQLKDGAVPSDVESISSVHTILKPVTSDNMSNKSQPASETSYTTSITCDNQCDGPVPPVVECVSEITVTLPGQQPEKVNVIELRRRPCSPASLPNVTKPVDSECDTISSISKA